MKVKVKRIKKGKQVDLVAGAEGLCGERDNSDYPGW
jgi:hypothetical protein